MAAAKEFEERRQQRNEQIQKRREEFQWRVFLSYADRLHSLDKARILIAHLERVNEDPSTIAAGRSLSDWIEWAKIRLEDYDPLNIEARRLFEEITKADDPFIAPGSQNLPRR